MHDHSTPANRDIYNYGLTSDGLTGFGSFLRNISQTVSGSVNIADHAARPSTAVTIEFFFQPQTNISGARAVSLLVDKATTGSANNDFGLTLEADSSISFYTYQGGSKYLISTSNTAWTAHQWYHVAAQINSAGGMSLWINGTLQNTINIGPAPDLTNTAPVRLYSNDNYVSSTTSNFGFDELRISNSARFTYNAAISTPATPYSNDGSTSYLLHFDTNNIVDSSANASITASNRVYVVKPFFSGSHRTFTVVNGFNNGSAISGHVVTGLTGKLIELRDMQNPSTMSENAVTNSSNTIGIEYYNKTSPTNFDFIQWNTGAGFILWAR
jgi:hypothetical protein